MALTEKAYFELTDRRAHGIDNPDDLIFTGETLSINNEHGSVDVRLAGGYVLGCSLSNETRQDVPVLYGGTDTFGEEPALQYKINATHLMNPVGPQEGQPQHGRHRYTDYQRVSWANPNKVIKSEEDAAGEPTSRLLIAADVPDSEPRHFRGLGMYGDGLKIRDMLFNTDTELRTSIGQHLYWVLNADSAAEPTLKGLSAEDVHGRPLFTNGALQKAFEGDSQFVPLPGGFARFVFPDNRAFQMYTYASTFDHNRNPLEGGLPAGLLAWRRPHTNSICFEPAYGVEYDGTPPINASELRNQGLVLPAGAMIDVQTYIAFDN